MGRIRILTLALSVLLGAGSIANASVLIDADVEDDGDWTTSAVLWTSDTTWLTPGFQEGSEAAELDGAVAASLSQTFSGLTLQPGTYTLQLAVGNPADGPFPANFNVALAGMGLGEAASAVTPTPAAGAWDLWTAVWDVGECHPNLGDPLSVEVAVSPGPGGNVRVDGVGTLSSDGNGLLISYVTALPGEYVLHGEATVGYPADLPKVFDAVGGRAAIDDPGTGTPTLNKLGIEVCWSGTFDAALFTGIPGSTVDLASYQRLNPALPQAGTGSTTTSIDWGTLTGWTQTGTFYCETSCPGGCGVQSGCIPQFGFEGTGPALPLSSTSLDTGLWSFLPSSNVGVAFANPDFEITNIDFAGNVFSQDIRLVGVLAPAVNFGSTVCVVGEPTGSDWSWRLSDQSNTWSDLSVTNTASTAQELASLFATSINNQASPTVTADLLATPCFELNGGDPPFTLEVGAAGQTPDCVVDDFTGCAFNPVAIPLPVFLAVPALPTWALAAAAVTLAAVGWRRLRRGSGRS